MNCKNGHLQIIPVTGFPIKTTWRLIWLQRQKNTRPVCLPAFLEICNKQEKKRHHPE